MSSHSAGCLGVPFFGECNYDPSQPYLSYFTLGELLVVVSLLLTFRQLANPKVNFRLGVSQFDNRWLYWGVVSAAAFVLIAILVSIPMTPYPPLPVLGYPIFWELASALTVLGGSLWIIRIIGKRARFTEKNSARFCQTLLNIIGRGDPEEMSDIGEELISSLPKIFDHCSKYNEAEAREAENNGTDYKLANVVNDAFWVLELCSDPRFCRTLVYQMPNTATCILEEIAKSRLEPNMYILVQNLVGEAFENHESILYREKQFAPLERISNNFTRAAFGNYWLLNTLQPLRAFKYWERDHVESWQAARFFEVLEVAMNAYFSAGRFIEHSYAIHGGLDVAVSLAGPAVTRVNADGNYVGTSSDAESVLYKIEFGLERLIKVIAKNESKLPEYAFDESNYDQHNDNSIYGYMARAVFDYFCALSRAKNQRAARTNGIGIWIKLFPASKSTPAITAIRNRLIARLKEKVLQNLSSKFPAYPAITKYLITLNGLSQPGDNRAGEQDFQNWFLDELKQKYAQLVRDHPAEAINMIPGDCEYVPERNMLRLKKLLRGEPTEFQLDPAPSQA